jgi:hypothetical protein
VSRATVEGRLRRFLLALAAVIAVGTVVELLLVPHVDEPLQWIPFAVAAAGLWVIAAVWRRPTAGRVRRLRRVMGLALAASLLGIVLHLRGNLDFLRETKPRATTLETAWGMVHGASPLLAPGVLALMAACAVAATHDLAGPDGLPAAAEEPAAAA